MESEWTNNHAIIRDLSVAQGRIVPARIEGSIGIGEKPPVLSIEEETEEEFFQHCTGNGALHERPDLGMIKQMLDLVRDMEVSSDIDDGDTEKIIEISKPFNPCCNEFVPINNGGGDCSKDAVPMDHSDLKKSNVNKKSKKPRIHRNVALTSLLESLEKKEMEDQVTEVPDLEKIYDNCIANNSYLTPKEPIKLLKPNDFITNPDLAESIEKVNTWLESPKHQQAKPGPVTVLPMDMFKKKSKPAVLENCSMFQRKEDNRSPRNTDAEFLNRQQNISYVPSTLADEYYQKYVERSKIHEITKADIWERAERKMKEIDAKRMQQKQQEAELALSPTSTLDESTNSSQKQGMDLVRLCQHRHDLPEECVVCQVLCDSSTPEDCTSPAKDSCADSIYI